MEFPWQPRGRGFSKGAYGCYGGFHGNRVAGLLHGSLLVLWGFPWQPGGGGCVGAYGRVSIATGGRGFSMGIYGSYGGFHGNRGGGASLWEPMGVMGVSMVTRGAGLLHGSQWGPTPNLWGPMVTLWASAQLVGLMLNLWRQPMIPTPNLWV